MGTLRTRTKPSAGDVILGWNLGLVEFLYLVPVNLLVLWLAFRPSKQPRSSEQAGDRKLTSEQWIARIPSGLVTALTGMMYAPVRFFLDYLRPENSDPRHLGFTFAQWASVAAFGASSYLATRLIRSGKPAETVTRTSREAQERLRVILKEDEEELAKTKAKGKPESRNEPPKPDKPDPADKASKRSFSAGLNISERVTRAAYARGVVFRAFTDGCLGFAPALCLTAGEVEQIMARVRLTLDDVLAQPEVRAELA